MPTPEAALAGVILAALTLYALSGGADYGGGVWDLFAFGPRAAAQRRLIAQAISPIWEANHVWLILVLVVLFSAFPPAFVALSISLHIPLTLMLIGVVLRGSAFAFLGHDPAHDAGPRRPVAGANGEDAQRPFGAVFAVASLVTPVLLGVTIGAVASGRVALQDGTAAGGFLRPWLFPFPFAVGAFALCLFALLAAVYLCVEAADPALQDDFRARALVAAGAGAATGVVALLLARHGAPALWQRLVLPAMWPLYGLAAASSLVAAGALWRRRYRLARVCAAAQVTLVLWGWALAQFPVLVEPDITIYNAAAPARSLHLLLLALSVGAVLLLPSFLYLYRVFKSPPA